MVGAHRVQEIPAVLLRGLGQLALVETATGGVLVLAAIVLINPWCALGAMAGVMFGTLAGCRYTSVTREEWCAGLAGFNGAVIGIMAGGFVSTDSGWAGAVCLAAIACLGFEFAMRKALARWALPVLTMPAVCALILTSLILTPSGTWLWVNPGPSVLGGTGTALAILCVVFAMAGKSLPATLQLVVLSCAAILACRWWGIDPLSKTGLWAFTIVPASFTVHAVFMGGSLLGGVAGCVAAAIGVSVWILWYLSGLGDVIPPLLAPFVVGVWGALLIFRRLGQPVILQPAFWQAVAALAKARLKKKRVVVVVSNMANDGSQPVLTCPEDATIQNFVASRSARRVWWKTCHDLRERYKDGTPQAIHRALERLQRRLCPDTLITFAMDGLLQRAGATHLVEAQGRLDTVRCLGCRIELKWPPANVWRSCDLHCSKCGELMMPGPPALENVIATTRQALDQSLEREGVLMVIGTLGDARAGRSILDAARLCGARIINITPTPSPVPLRTGEVLVRGNICSIVHGFVRLLITLSLADPSPGTHGAHPAIESGRDNP